MKHPTCLKDLSDRDIQTLDQIAQAQGWTEIHYDMVSERQVRRL